MAYFPFYIELSKKKGLVVGAGKVALEKIEKLLEFDADLCVVAPKFLPEIREEKRIQIREKKFDPKDLDGFDYVIAATNQDALNERIYELCQEKKIYVNVVDNAKLCDFIFASVIKRGKLCIGISTSGASPKAGIMLKNKINSQLPDDIEERLDALYEIRKYAKENIKDTKERRAYLEEMTVKYLSNWG